MTDPVCRPPLAAPATAAPVRYVIRLFAAARQLAGQEAVTVTGTAGITVGELKASLHRHVPALADLPTCRLAVNQAFVPEGTRLRGDEEIACIPPVSGG